MRARTLLLLVTLAALWATPAAAQLDPLSNRGQCLVSTGYDASATSIVLTSSCAGELPTAATNYAWCNVTDYPTACMTTAGVLDPNYEIVRCTRSADTLTCTRNAEGSYGASTKNAGGKAYWVFVWTAKWSTDVNTALGASFVTTATNGVLTNEAVLTGTTNQVNVSGATISLPQNIHTSATPRFSSLGLGVAAGAAETITFATNNALAGVDANGLNWYPKGTAAGAVAFLMKTATTGDSGGDQNQTSHRVYASTGNNSLQGNNYFNSVFTFGVTDGTNFKRPYEMGTEGNWTNAGGFTQQRWYLWQFGLNGTGGQNIAYIDRTEDMLFKFQPPDTGNGYDGVAVQVGGNTVNAQADGWIGGLKVGPGAFTKNDSNTRTFPFVQIKPTLNFGGSNTNTTVNVFDIDTTNTSTTGATVNLFRALYGGSPRLTLSSAGLLALTGSHTVSADLTVDTNTLHVDSTNNRVGFGTASPTQRVDVVTTGTEAVRLGMFSATGASFFMAHAQGTEATPLRLGSGETIGSFSFAGYQAVDGVTTATATANLAQVRAVTQEALTSTGQGTRLEFRTVAIGSTSIAARALVNEYGLTLGSALAARGSTNPTNALTLVRGTAAAGSCTDCIQHQNVSGVGRITDEAGVVQMTTTSNKALTDNSAVNVISMTVAALTGIGGVLHYTIEATDGTDIQVETGTVVISAINKAGTVTATATEVNSQQNLSAGTMTTTWAASAATPTVISVNANTSLSPSAGYPRITFRLVDNMGRQAFTLP